MDNHLTFEVPHRLVFSNVNEEGEVYAKHDSMEDALLLLNDFPNDSIEVRYEPVKPVPVDDETPPPTVGSRIRIIAEGVVTAYDAGSDAVQLDNEEMFWPWAGEGVEYEVLS